MKRAIVLLLTLALAACSTTPTPLAQATPGTITYNQTVVGVPATAIFIRDSGIVGAAMTTHLYVDGQPAATLNVGETVTLSLSAGEYLIGIDTAFSGLFSIDQQLTAGRTYYYRILSDPNGQRIMRVSGS